MHFKNLIILKKLSNVDYMNNNNNEISKTTVFAFWKFSKFPCFRNFQISLPKKPGLFLGLNRVFFPALTSLATALLSLIKP